jgi:Spy/CpxP family protein refolding chaperone
MFGFIVGTLSLIGLIKVSRFGRFGRGGYRRFMLRRLYRELDTTHGQEKVIAQVADDVERAAWAAGDVMRQTRSAAARAMRAEHFDQATLNEALDQQQAALDAVKKAAREGLGQVHEALTPEQRAHLADLLEFGPRHARGGCHGGHHHHHGHFRRGPQPGPAGAVSL